MSTELRISVDAEQYPLDLSRLVGQAKLTDISLLRHGTDGGQASVALVAELPSGKQILVETTWKLFKTAFLALEASPVVAEETW